MKTKSLIVLFTSTLFLFSCASNGSIPSAPKLTRIEIAEPPVKSDYFVGDFFDPTGLKVSVTYDDKTTSTIEYVIGENYLSFVPSLDTPLSLQNDKVTISYGTISVDFEISVVNEVIPTSVNFDIDEVTSASIHTPKQEEYALCDNPDKFFEDNFSADYLFGRKNYATPKGIEISYDLEANGNSIGEFYVVTSENSDFSDSYSHLGDKEHTYLYNLKINTKYYYKVRAIYHNQVFESDTKEFVVEDTTIRNIYVDGVENIRDLGGYKNSDGKYIKQGFIYRTAQFNYDHDDRQAIQSEPTEKGKEVLLNQLKIKTEIDVRDTHANYDKDETIGITSSPIGESVNYVSLPMKYGGKNVITNEANKESFKSFLETCADINNYPIAFHCIRGTDRTGAMAYAIGALCGISELDLIKDYLFSNFANIKESMYLTSEKITGEDFYVYGINQEEGNTLSEKAKSYLIKNIGVSLDTLNSIIDILVED